MKNGHQSLCRAVLFGMLLAAEAGQAARLVYFDEDFGSGNPGAFYNFDTLTGLSVLRSTVAGPERFFGMDVRPSDGTVWAVSYSPTPGLFRVDVDTGQYSLVGLTGGHSPFVGLAFHPMTGELFGMADIGELYTINQNTGAATFIGDTFNVERGLAFSPSGQLFGFSSAGWLYRVDPATGGESRVGLSGNPVLGVSEDATFTSSGELFATDYQGRIFHTDPVTGNGVLIGATGHGDGLLALIPEPVPEPSAIVLFGLGVCALFFTRKLWKK